MAIKVRVAGATGWVGQILVREIVKSSEFTLSGAIARSSAGADIGTVLGLEPAGVIVSETLSRLCQNRQMWWWTILLQVRSRNVRWRRSVEASAL